MSLVVDIASWALILAGSFFTVVGALGLVRMPDLFTRMHAVGIIDTLGVGFLVAGMILQAGFSLVTLKLLILLALVFFTWPVVTHALAQVCLHEDIQPKLVEDRRAMALKRLKGKDEAESLYDSLFGEVARQRLEGEDEGRPPSN